ncbi:MAG: helix-turn-helix transcriptional regulator [Pseudomonadales bacterium]
MTRDEWVQSSDNIFKDLGFGEEEAAVLKIKADLMIEIEKVMKAKKLTQTRAAEIMGVPRPRLNRMLHGRFDGITIDKMVQMLERSGKHVSIKVDKKKAA